MTAEERQQMNSLCTRIQEEKDYAEFVALLRQLRDLVERKYHRFGHPGKREWQRSGPWKTLPATVSKVLAPTFPKDSGRVEISILGADDLFREIRIENGFTDVDGQPVALNPGAHLDVTIEAKARDSGTTSTESAP